MKRIIAAAVVVAAFGMGSAIASETKPSTSIEQQVRDLKKMVGAGEISSKEYNKRVAALRAGEGQQTAETKK